jgi:Uma2 family endonuclease
MSAVVVSNTMFDYSPIFEIDFGKALKKMDDDEFFEFCQRNKKMRIEMDKHGAITIMPPTGSETGGKNFTLIVKFGIWTEKDGTGKGFDSSTGFRLPNGAKRSPDLSWMTLEKWNAIPAAKRKKFAPVCPDFVVELRSETDSLRKLKNKMQEYIENGAALGWLIDAGNRKIYVYRPNAEVETLENPTEVSGEPLLQGFTLNSAQSIEFPNELKGFKFFGNGKLKSLQFTVSSKVEVKKILGETCEKKCDYDADWLISFEYYEDIWIKESRNDKDEKLTYFLDSKYLGKLRSIEIRPKKQVSFDNVSFPAEFQKLVVTSTTDARSGKSRMTVNDAFQDSDGLTYEIYSRTNYDDIKNKKEKSYNKGELILIRYDIPKESEKTLFVLQK